MNNELILCHSPGHRRKADSDCKVSISLKTEPEKEKKSSDAGNGSLEASFAPFSIQKPVPFSLLVIGGNH